MGCLAPEHREQRWAASVRGRGNTLVRLVELAPPRPTGGEHGQLAEVLQTSPAAHARGLARTARRLWTQFSGLSRRAGSHTAVAEGHGLREPHGEEGAPLHDRIAIAMLARELGRVWGREVFVGLLELEDATRSELCVALQAVAIQLEATARRHDSRETARRKQALKARLLDARTGLRTACRVLRAPWAGPLATLRAAHGEYTSDPLEVDRIAMEAWDPVFNPGRNEPLSDLMKYLDLAGTQVRVTEEFLCLSGMYSSC